VRSSSQARSDATHPWAFRWHPRSRMRGCTLASIILWWMLEERVMRLQMVFTPLRSRPRPSRTFINSTGGWGRPNDKGWGYFASCSFPSRYLGGTRRYFDRRYHAFRIAAVVVVLSSVSFSRACIAPAVLQTVIRGPRQSSFPILPRGGDQHRNSIVSI
jgi:hypothetical protein